MSIPPVIDCSESQHPIRRYNNRAGRVATLRITPPATAAMVKPSSGFTEPALDGRSETWPRVTADSMWMEAVVGPAIARFHETFPAVELKLSTASFAEALRRLMGGESDLHCGDIDAGTQLPGFLRREHVLDITAGIVAGERHPLLAARAAVGDLSGYPWIDYGGPAPAGTAAPTDPSSLPAVLDALYAYAGKRVKTVVRADTLGLFLLETGPWLAWLPLNFLDALAGPKLRPLPLKFGRYRYRAGFIARRSAEDLAPFQQLEETVRDAALERSWQTHR